ncbi:MAG TPA: hypothetical protein EYP56_16240, partial [Planctomycetaceae bacterium]|nr:hypothetical protein [Planctomycetaceae bacterium]
MDGPARRALSGPLASGQATEDNHPNERQKRVRPDSCSGKEVCVDTAAIERAYGWAKERYATWGVDADRALERLSRISISLHCWQGDDVSGFESPEGLTGGGIMATGCYPGRARTADQLRSDLEAAYRLIPG